jgi:hypothetical protein
MRCLQLYWEIRGLSGAGSHKVSAEVNSSEERRQTVKFQPTKNQFLWSINWSYAFLHSAVWSEKQKKKNEISLHQGIFWIGTVIPKGSAGFSVYFQLCFLLTVEEFKTQKEEATTQNHLLVYGFTESGNCICWLWEFSVQPATPFRLSGEAKY